MSVLYRVHEIGGKIELKFYKCDIIDLEVQSATVQLITQNASIASTLRVIYAAVS